MADGGGSGTEAAMAATHDADEMLREVLADLERPLKRISSKFHYDERGSELFETITRLDEYYPTRTERMLLERAMPIWTGELRPATLVELGAGNAEKSRIVLNSMVATGRAEAYVPIDVSHDFLQDTADKLRSEYPGVSILPQVADMTVPIGLPDDLSEPMWIAFLGSTLGNFDDAGAIALLTRIAAKLAGDDRLLLGVDLRPGPKKSKERIELAYNDAAGVTAEFSLNVLAVLNREVGSDFDLSGFSHRSYYDVARGRIETYLDSLREQAVSFPDGTVIAIGDGEAIRTEISCKYDRPTIEGLFGRSGLTVDRWVEDEDGYYALVLATTEA